VTALGPADRDAYWNGDESVLARYGVAGTGATSDFIHTVIIDIHPDARSHSEDTADLDDGDLEAAEFRRELEERRKISERRDAPYKAMVSREPAIPSAPPNAYHPENEWDRKA
jgi:hypothetical protein